MKKDNKNNEFNRIQRFSIRKYSFGAASVAIATYLMFMGNGAVYAAQEGVRTEGTEPKVGEVVTPKEEPQKEAPKAESLDKSKLIGLIAEIETNLSDGTYNNKTDESLSLLKSEVESAKSTVVNATSQEELEVAYRSLFTTKNTKLKSKPVEKKETPEVDTTEGKETVGKKAENTEPKAGTNAIENTGTNDSRNGKEIGKDNPFRTEATDTEGPVAEIPYANDKNVYVYGAEEDGFDIKIKDNSGVVANATILRGGNQPFNTVSGETDMLDVEFGYKANEFSKETTASESNPAVIHYTGLPGGTLNKNQLAEARTTGLNLGWRYVKATDKSGNTLRAIDANDNAPGALYVIVKPQTYKYDVVNLSSDNKISVANAAQLTVEELANIKNGLKVEYSKNNDDAQLESKKGTLLDNARNVVDTVADSGENIVVTYKDGSTDTIAKGKLIKSGPAPVVTGNPKARNTVLSTDEELSGTGTVGATVKVTIKNPEGTEVISEKTTQVGTDGTWKLALDKGLNSNEELRGASTAARTFYAPKNIVFKQQMESIVKKQM